MVLATSAFAKILSIKGMHIDKVDSETVVKGRQGEQYTQEIYRVHARPWKKIRHQCPLCRKVCPKYDTKRATESQWRAPNINGAHVHVCYNPDRIECPEHGVRTEYIPWADGDSRFTADFNNEVAFLALTIPRTVVAEFMDIDWKTVGNCIKAAHDRLEPDVTARLEGLSRICIDETSYKKGHSYITVVVDMDRNRVVWVDKGHDNETIDKFCELLTPEQRERITIIAGDGARWIDHAHETYFPHAKRCLDPFHVVGWINKAMDDVRIQVSAAATRQLNAEKKAMEEEADRLHNEWLGKYAEYNSAKVELEGLPVRGRPSFRKLELQTIIREFEDAYGETIELLASQGKGTLSEEQKQRLDELQEKTKAVKGSKYALAENPENLPQYNRDRLELIKANNPELYEAYQMKESLRVIIHMTDAELASTELDKWVATASESKFSAFRKLSEKIKERKEGILNSIIYQANSSRSEQTNGTIKTLIRIGRGFRNLENMYALIYLRCSDIIIPLTNRYRPSKEKVRQLREHADELRRLREEAAHKEKIV